VKILIIGFGSIGRRHLNNLVELGYQDISLVRRNTDPIDNFRVFSTIHDACETQRYQYAIIATPSAIHFQNFNELITYNIPNIYIEKPVSNLLEEAFRMEKIANKKNVNVVVGYDLHFDIGLNKVRELLTNKEFGKALTFQSEVGQYLPDWRPHEDYRNGMSAKKSLGGGVMLDLIHEFDYVQWIFGTIVSVLGIHRKISSLAIDSEDVSITILETDKGIVGSVYLDYLQKELSRKCKIVFNKGTIVWDYGKSNVKWMTHEDSTWKEYSYANFQRNDRFVEIIKAFMNSNLYKDSRLTSLAEGIKSLKIVVAAKKSSVDNKLIRV